MKPIKSAWHTATKKHRKHALGLRRWELIKLSLIAVTVFFLMLVGCASEEDSVDDVASNMGVIDRWIEAVNSEDVAQFESLHSETVVFHSYLQQHPFEGRENLWESFRRSNAGSIEETYMFGQDRSICLQAAAADPTPSFLYIFDFEGDLISRVYEYMAVYDLSEVPLFEGVEITTDDAGLSERIDLVDSQAKAVTERDYSGYIETFNENIIRYVPLFDYPGIGKDVNLNAVQNFTRAFPEVELLKYRTFGSGNLVCTQWIARNISVSPPVRSLGLVSVFENGKVSRNYEYFSSAELIN